MKSDWKNKRWGEVKEEKKQALLIVTKTAVTFRHSCHHQSFIGCAGKTKQQKNKKKLETTTFH